MTLAHACFPKKFVIHHLIVDVRSEIPFQKEYFL